MQFDFGENWFDYSKRALTPERIDQAKADLTVLTEGIELHNKRFLDIGFGQGLTLLTAASMGAKATGCDINPKCANRHWSSSLWHFIKRTYCSSPKLI